MSAAEEFDYVIAGGGTAGCVVAARLSEVTDREGEAVPQSGAAQGANEVAKGMANAKRN